MVRTASVSIEFESMLLSLITLKGEALDIRTPVAVAVAVVVAEGTIAMVVVVVVGAVAVVVVVRSVSSLLLFTNRDGVSL